MCDSSTRSQRRPLSYDRARALAPPLTLARNLALILGPLPRLLPRLRLLPARRSVALALVLAKDEAMVVRRKRA